MKKLISKWFNVNTPIIAGLAVGALLMSATVLPLAPNTVLAEHPARPLISSVIPSHANSESIEERFEVQRVREMMLNQKTAPPSGWV